MLVAGLRSVRPQILHHPVLRVVSLPNPKPLNPKPYKPRPHLVVTKVQLVVAIVVLVGVVA